MTWVRLGALFLALAFTAGAAAGDVPARPPWAPASELGLMPCFAFEGACVSEPIFTSDGRIFIQVVPVYAGKAFVFVDGGVDFHKHVATCQSPTMESCTWLVETQRAGTYRVSVEFGEGAAGALLLEVLTPS